MRNIFEPQKDEMRKGWPGMLDLGGGGGDIFKEINLQKRL
jgi:hypothetical protein